MAELVVFDLQVGMLLLEGLRVKEEELRALLAAATLLKEFPLVQQVVKDFSSSSINWLFTLH